VDVFNNYVKPHIDRGHRAILVVIDNMRLDQWLVLEPLLRDYFRINRDYYFSILPTATPYARNAIFSGLFPADIEKQIPDLWQNSDENDDTSCNRFESQLMERQLQRLKIELKPAPKYVKILDIQEARSMAKRIQEYADTPFSSIVLNFVDILAHTAVRRI
jgi:hypothetical protein